VIAAKLAPQLKLPMDETAAVRYPPRRYQQDLNALLGRDPCRSISATEGDKALRGEPSFAPDIDRLPILGGRDHCIEAPETNARIAESRDLRCTCAAVGAAGGAFFANRSSEPGSVCASGSAHGRLRAWTGSFGLLCLVV